MTGLNLESFLHLLRADLGAWATLALIGLVLALMTWTSWGSRRALRKCLVLSVAAHIVLVAYGSTIPLVLLAFTPRANPEASRDRIRQIKVAPWAVGDDRSKEAAASGKSGHRVDAWDKENEDLALAEPKVNPTRPEGPKPEEGDPAAPPPLPPETATPEVNPPLSNPVEAPPAESPDPSPAPDQAAPADPSEIAPAVIARPSAPEVETSPLDAVQVRRRPSVAAAGAKEGARPPRDDLPAFVPPVPAPVADSEGPPQVALGPPLERPSLTGGDADETAMQSPGGGGSPDAVAGDPNASGVSAPIVKRPDATPSAPEMPAIDVRRRTRPTRSEMKPDARVAERSKALESLALSRATPGGLPALPEVRGAIGARPLTDVPEVYRSRLDPNRSSLAQRAGASAASEQAVERALDWLARHQDNDGRWDAGVARFPDGTPVKGDDDFTVHCPPGEPCTGECFYWEADTALTGLSLLAFLGSGYTHTDGKYTETVGKGLDFLRKVQKANGDLRGDSKAVGMYCHAMASLALCEAYALTGDAQLREPVGRAIDFLIRSRARDGLAWRYQPGADRGDTSILGWVVMALKSAKVVGIPIPRTIQDGTLTWLGRVASGTDRGLASYQPGQPPTPTMTAEAWVCRQFLGVGGPGATSDEAAGELLANTPNRPGRDTYNLYYWYYGTLAMYQHGGKAWARWNAQVRDQVVRRQRLEGHRAGSWDPDDSDYGARGGRIYCTALATLTLEVYYRFLRLYDDPDTSPSSPPLSPARAGNSPRRNRS